MSWFSEIWRYGLTAKQRARRRAVEQYVRTLAAFERELMTTSVDEAEIRARELLASSKVLQASAWDGDRPDLSSFGPRTRSLFEVMRRVGSSDGGSYVDATELAPLDGNPSYLRIGSDSSDGHVDLAILPTEDRLFVISNDVPIEDAIDTVWPSIFHWIIALQRGEELQAEIDDEARPQSAAPGG